MEYKNNNKNNSLDSSNLSNNYSFKRISNPQTSTETINKNKGISHDGSPNFGRFQNVGNNKKTKYFYSCPAKETVYQDHDTVIEHVDNMLSEIRGDPWVWIFDSNGFGVKHYLEIRTAQSLAKLISDKYSDSLQQIVVLNPSWHMRLTLNVIWPFLSDKIKNTILIK